MTEHFGGYLVFCLAFALLFGTDGTLLAQPAGARISGSVVDPQGHVLPDATVMLEPTGTPDSSAGVLATTTTDRLGRFSFDDITPGTYVVTVELSGYSLTAEPSGRLAAGQSAVLTIAMAIAPLSEIVNVVGSTGAGEPVEADEIEPDLLRVFQLPTDRFQEALPLLPGVIRDPRGRLSFNGTRPSQSALLVNGVNATDPVTGQFAMELPLSVVETVEVHAIPYSAEFGRVSGAIVNVSTRAGDDHWDVDFGGLVPTPRVRDGTLKGINTATPRVKVSGPLSEGRAWVSQAFSYRYARTRVKEEIQGADEEIIEGFDAFTQIDVKINDRHSITGTVSVFPSTVENQGIDSLTPALATPDTETDGWNLALADTLVTGTDTLWRTQLALRAFDVAVRPKGTGVTRLTPDGVRGTYFNTIDRQSRQLEMGIARSQNMTWGGRSHLITLGAQLMATSFDGVDRSGPIEVVGADGRLLKRITFRGSGALESSDVVTSGYVQDHWRLNERLALDLGLRFDHDEMIGESHFSPRTAFSLALDDDGRTVVKGGWGLFFDQVFLQVDAFQSFQQRVEQDFLGTPDRPLGAAVVYENRVDADFEAPVSRVWNLELDRQLGASLMLRVNYRENRARDRLIVTRVTDTGTAALLLSSTGRLTAKEFDTTLRWTLADGGELFASFSKIRTDGDLNDFGLVYDTVRDPLVLDNEVGQQPFDVPDRVLLWGVVRIPWGLTLTPGIEWRDGFRYTVFAEDYTVAEGRNLAKFPSFFSADIAITKRITLLGRETDVGIQIYNLGSHDNPRDVFSNQASDQFGVFRNSVGTSIGLRVGVDL